MECGFQGVKNSWSLDGPVLFQAPQGMCYSGHLYFTSHYLHTTDVYTEIHRACTFANTVVQFMRRTPFETLAGHFSTSNQQSTGINFDIMQAIENKSAGPSEMSQLDSVKNLLEVTDGLAMVVKAKTRMFLIADFCMRALRTM
jgi:hypothetical protein